MKIIETLKALRRQREREREREQGRAGQGGTYEVRLEIPVGYEVVGVSVREVSP